MGEKTMKGSAVQEEKSVGIRPPVMVLPAQGDQEAIRNQPSPEYPRKWTGIHSLEKTPGQPRDPEPEKDQRTDSPDWSSLPILRKKRGRITIRV